MAAEEFGFISLAELSQVDVSDIKAQLNRLPEPGLYRVRLNSVNGKEFKPEGEKAGAINFMFGMDILAAKPTNPAVDGEALVGKKLTHSYRIKMKDMASMQEDIALLKGNYQKVGLPHDGALGGNPEHPGFLEGGIGHEFDVRVRINTSTQGGEFVNIDWLTKEAAEAAFKA